MNCSGYSLVRVFPGSIGVEIALLPHFVATIQLAVESHALSFVYINTEGLFMTLRVLFPSHNYYMRLGASFALTPIASSFVTISSPSTTVPSTPGTSTALSTAAASQSGSV